MKTLLIAGGIGSGKSLLCRALAERGVKVYDCDSAAKTIYERDGELLARVENAVGTSLRGSDGTFDRRALASEIFGNSLKRMAVEAIVHPAVFGDFFRWRDTLPGGTTFACMETALFEKGKFPFVDKVLFVDAPLELRIRRICARDGVTEDEARTRIAAQALHPEDADAVINNENEAERFLSEAFAIIDELLK